MECRICNNSNLIIMFCWPKFPLYIWPIDKNYHQEYEDLQIYWCHDCGLVQLDKFNNEFIKKLYSKDVFGLVSSNEFQATSVNNNNFLDYCSKILGNDWSHGKKLLDVGGYDVLTCYDLDFSEAAICDPNAPQIKYKDNIRICRNFFSRNFFTENYFDVVVAKHILEHINDISDFMQDIRFVLKDKGTLIIEVPELLSGITERGSFATFYHQHLMYFDKFSLNNLLKKYGFSISNLYFGRKIIRIIAEKYTQLKTPLSYKIIKNVPVELQNYKTNLDNYFIELEKFLKFNGKEKIICYGAGGSTTILFHLCEFVKNIIEVVIDSSMNKIDKKIGGTDFIVNSPQILKSFFNRNILINSDMFFNEIVKGIEKSYIKHNYHILKIFSKFENINLSGVK